MLRLNYLNVVIILLLCKFFMIVVVIGNLNNLVILNSWVLINIYINVIKGYRLIWCFIIFGFNICLIMVIIMYSIKSFIVKLIFLLMSEIII